MVSIHGSFDFGAIAESLSAERGADGWIKALEETLGGVVENRVGRGGGDELLVGDDVWGDGGYEGGIV